MTQDFLKDYELVWNDEFDGEELDLSKWRFKPEMLPQSDLGIRSDETAVSVNDGILRLTSDRIRDEKYYANVSLTTFEKMSFQYGYIEIRAKVPFARPAWPSFWLISDPNKRLTTLWKSEIDIFEGIGIENVTESTLHKWYHDGTRRHFSTPAERTTRKVFASKEEAQDWHTYGMLWTSEFIKFFVDGEVFQVFDITDKGDYVSDDYGMGGHHDPHYVIFNNHVYTKGYQGCQTWAKGREATPEHKFPINFDIDYVRLYQKPDEGKLIIY